MSTLNKPIVVRVPWPSTLVAQARVLSWGFSIAVHLLIVLVVAWCFPYWMIPQRGVPNGDGRSFDLTLLGPGDSFSGGGNDAGNGNDPTGVELVASTVELVDLRSEPLSTNPEMADENESPAEPIAETEIEESEPPALDPSLPGRRVLTRPRGGPAGRSSPDSETEPAPGRAGGGRRGRAMGGTQFFGASGVGKRFVYVVDRSSSMHSYNAIGVARAELAASLRDLDASKQFQVVFYNMKASLIPSREEKATYLWATDVNREEALQYIKTVFPDGGTDRFPALRKALELKPDVIFFLTDAEYPIMEPAEMERVRQMNGGRVQIHVIEFGQGGPLRDDNFLKVLAHQNKGTYTYHDVKEFSQAQNER